MTMNSDIRADVYPLARSQEMLWEVLQACHPHDPGSADINVCELRWWDGEFSLPAFRAALVDVCRRQDALRIVFTDTGFDPALRIVPEIDPPIEFVDLSGEPAGRQQARLAALVSYHNRRGFPLLDGPPWTVHVLRLSEHRHAISVALSHLIADGSSLQVFFQELRAAYRVRTGTRDELPPLSLSFRDVIASRPERAELDRWREYWRRSLAPLPQDSPFPLGATCPVTDTAALLTRATYSLVLPDRLTRELHALARRQHTTPFAVLFAGYRVLLGARTGWDRLILCCNTRGRNLPGAKALIGQFTNDVSVATELPPDTSLLAALRTVHRATFTAVSSTASYQEVARSVHPDFDRDRPWPMHRTYHALMLAATPSSEAAPPAPGRPGTGSGQVQESRSQGRPSQLPPAAGRTERWLREWIRMAEPKMTVSHDRSTLTFAYSPTFFDRDMVATLTGEYRSVLEAMVSDPQRTLADVARSLSHTGCR